MAEGCGFYTLVSELGTCKELFAERDLAFSAARSMPTLKAVLVYYVTVDDDGVQLTRLVETLYPATEKAMARYQTIELE